MALASVAFLEAAAMLNDATQVLFTDAVLLPFLQRSHRELQLKLDARQSSVQKEVTAIITVLAGAVELGASLPADFLRPIKMQEGNIGAPPGQYADMIEAVWDKNIQPTANIGFWTFREEVIQFPPATQNRSIMLYYIKGLTVPVAGTSPLGLTRAETFISAKTAHYAAKYIMQDEQRAADLLNDADGALKDYFDAEVRGQQGVPTRRKPYGTRWSKMRYTR